MADVDKKKPIQGRKFGHRDVTMDVDATTSSYSIPFYPGCPRIELLGIPHEGAKSRVEIQLKLCLRLVDSDGNSVTDYDFLDIDDHLVLISSRFIRSNRMTMAASNVSSTAVGKRLRLSAEVLCVSNPEKPIYMCIGCIQREQKRLLKRKDASSVDDKYNDDAEWERRRILMFNCGRVVDFSTGTICLGTRLACYCRHHDEKVGFNIVFSFRDETGSIIASITSPPIMITDDHKTTKQRGLKRPRADKKEEGREGYYVGRTSNSSSFSSSSSTTGLDVQPHTPYCGNGPYLTPPISPNVKNMECVKKDIIMEPINISTVEHLFEETAALHSVIAPRDQDVLRQQELQRLQVLHQDHRPTLIRIVPGEGSVMGGTDCTVLGSNFRHDHSVFFGGAMARHTEYWGNSTLLCISPPALHTGPAVVDVRDERGQGVGTSDPMVNFIYKDDTAYSMMALALQIIGMQKKGTIEDANDIALQIIRAESCGGSGDISSIASVLSGASSYPVDEVDSVIFRAITSLSTTADMQGLLDLNLCDNTGHCLLHYAAWLGAVELVRLLVSDVFVDLNVGDYYDFAPLHFATARGHLAVVDLLISAGADVTVLTAERLAPIDFACTPSVKNLLSSSATGISSDLEEASQGDEKSEHADDALSMADSAKNEEACDDMNSIVDSLPSVKMLWDDDNDDDDDLCCKKSSCETMACEGHLPGGNFVDPYLRYQYATAGKISLRKRDRLRFNFLLPLLVVLVALWLWCHLNESNAADWTSWSVLLFGSDRTIAVF